MSKNKKIFYLVFAIFILVAILVTVDMANRTTPPWKKRKDDIKNKYKVDHFKKKLCLPPPPNFI